MKNKWEDKHICVAPTIKPSIDKNKYISLEQPIQFESGESEVVGENENKFKPIHFIFTINKPEIPVPMEFNSAIHMRPGD